MRRGALYYKARGLARVAARSGVSGLARTIGSYVRDQKRKTIDGRAFDRAGYDTAERTFLHGLTLAGGDPSDANPYDATPRYDFEAAVALLDIPAEGASLIDLGSGKGRILMLAAAHPFAAIVGVEFAHELQSIAQANLARYCGLHGPDDRITLWTGDAAEFAFPEGPLVVFLFNPFGAATLANVARNLGAAWQAAPRPIRILYVNPQHGPEMAAAGFRLIAATPDNRVAAYAPDDA